jgi:gamma-glutamyl hercynylcysteine S-oxide synthase
VTRSFRQAGPTELAAALRSSRAATLATFDATCATLPHLQVPYRPELNPPLWELGHVNWFAQHWLARNPQWRLGTAANPLAPRTPALAPDSDTLFDSTLSTHPSRWHQNLPPQQALRDALEAGLERTLALLQAAEPTDQGLYFHRLVLAHEDMHHEAALYMAQALGVPAPTHAPLPSTSQPWLTLQINETTHTLGHQDNGFVFDNECGAHTVHLPSYAIDNRVVTWHEYLPFVQAGGYQQQQWWCEAGWQWLNTQAQPTTAPRYLRPLGADWEQQRSGKWQPLNLHEPACHLTAFEAEAWCRWAGRRLPLEAEWEHAALAKNATAANSFTWGAVWEWTASPFTPYPGFAPHPYLDYSLPWFGSRQVLRGASVATQPRMVEARYRNYFTPDRNDIFAGFRSCKA